MLIQGAFQIFASVKVPQRFNVERSIALGNTNVAAHSFRSRLTKLKHNEDMVRQF
jgi:hypothetical protein